MVVVFSGPGFGVIAHMVMETLVLVSLIEMKDSLRAHSAMSTGVLP